jgi:hypothetical protein
MQYQQGELLVTIVGMQFLAGKYRIGQSGLPKALS